MKFKYFVSSIFAYAFGMILTFIALFFKLGGQGGQPALTFLVPTTVSTTIACAYWNNDLKLMWEGAGSHKTKTRAIESESLLL